MTENNGLPQDWVWSKLESIAEIILGQSPPSSTYNEIGEGLPFYQGKLEFGDIYPIPRKWCSAPKKIAEEGDVLISVRAPVGPTNICSERSCIGRGLAAIRPLHGISTKFVLHLLRAYESVLAGKGTGTTFNAITGNQLRELEIPLPPRPEQERIVAKIEELFTQLDAGVAELQQSRSQLHRYRQAVLKAAVEGELTSEWRETHKHELEPAEKLLASILSERRAKWEAEGCKGIFKVPTPPDSDGLRELPVGWIWACINQLSYNIQYGYTESAKEDPIGPKFLRITDIQDGKVDWDSVPYCRISDEKYIKYQLHSGDIVFTRTGATTGKSFLITSPPKAVFASYLIRLQLLSQINPKYIAQFFSSQSYWSQIMRVRKGSAQPGVNASILATLTVPLPPTNEQQRISEMVERRLSVADEIEKEIDQALARSERLRQSILKRVFEGKLVAQRLEDGDTMELVEGIAKKRTLAL